MQAGDRVRVLVGDLVGELGTVGYVRFSPPDFREVAMASVKLDCKLDSFRCFPAGYSGSTYIARDLELLPR